MVKVNALHTEASALLKSRTWFFGAKQKSLRQADAALAEIRKETKELEARVARATVPPRARDDAGAAILAAEVRSWLRAAPEAERLTLVERAIAGGNVALVAASLEQPLWPV